MRIALFSVKSFNLEKLIAHSLEKEGKEVFVFDERPTNNKWGKAILRIQPRLLKFWVNQYYKRCLKNPIFARIDVLLVLRGEVIPIWFLEKLKQINPKVNCIYYGSDSFSNNPNAIPKLPYFDKKHTFDPEDAKKYDLKYLPLFFEDEYFLHNNKKWSDRQFDVSVVGTVHSDRLVLLEKILKLLPSTNYRVHMYHHGWFILQIQRFLGLVKIGTFKMSNIQYRHLEKSELMDIYCNSKFIIDTHHPNQVGLTMRTFEALGARTKLITTNSLVNECDFYHPNNIAIIDRKNPVISKSFLSTEYHDLDKEIIKKYALSAWLNTLLS